MEFECPLTWESLESTKWWDEKYCSTCGQNVNHVETQEDLEYHAKQGHCVAFEATSRPGRKMGKACVLA
jgi:hypothetical protein